ncbi:hypothetical protein M1437_02825 [Patescibacteria group bacterium]|nr:hypothetical protein [Patescibacteria group bacterium]
MAKEKDLSGSERKERRIMSSGGTPGAVYGLGLIGALVYFIQHATSFWDGVFGVLKSLVWPAMLAYKSLEFFKL